MEIRHLQTFQVVVAEEMNLTKAAMQLNYSQPTITKHIKLLENEVGVSLFTREDGKRKLSNAGEILYKYCNGILNNVTELNKEIRTHHEVVPTIRVCGMDFYCYHYFLPKIEAFERKHPNVNIEIHSTTSDKTVQKVSNYEMDFGIAVGKQLTSEFESFQIDEEDLVLFASRKLVKNKSEKEQCIRDYPVLLDKTANYIYYGFLVQGLTFSKMIHCDNDEVLKKGVMNHPYIGIMGTGRLQQEIENDQVTLLDTYSSKVPVKIFTLRNSLRNPVFNEFFQMFTAV